jgi:putative N6-adenine-specific DNA methylase
VFVSTTPGLEPALRAEAETLGWSPREEVGGVTLSGPNLVFDANLWLRTASRVLLRVAQLREEREMAHISLRTFCDGPVNVRVVGELSTAARSRLERLAASTWKLKLSTSDDAPELRLRVHRGELTVSVDTSGALLHLRGYRQEIGRAPLRESLAAGMLQLAGYRGEEPLWDAMCGSGTLPIEAALIATRTPPGAARSFAFERWPTHDAAAWNRLREAALAQVRARPPHPIFATDLNAGALGTARRNARRAGIGSALTLERQDALDLRVPPGLPPGVVVANLPYGKRVGNPQELEPLYQQFGASLRRSFPGWRYALLVPESRGADGWLGLTPSDRWPVSNGGIRCLILVGELGR